MGEGEERAYLLNLENIVNFIFDNSNSTGDSEIVERYVMNDDTKNITLNEKTIREIKSKEITTQQTVRYELVKTLMDRLMDINDEELTLGETIVVNTMLNEGLIMEVK